MAEIRYFLKKVSSGNETPLTGEVSIGRGDSSKIRLTEGNPSRNHALISVRDGLVWLKDRGSMNGTFVNGTRLDNEKEMRLAANDKIRFDLEEYTLRVEAPPEPAPDKDRTAMSEAKPVIAEAAKSNDPPRWAVTGFNASGGNSTVFQTPEQMEEERKRARARAAHDVASNVPVTVPQLTIYGDGAPLVVQLRVVDPAKCEWNVGSDEGREIRIQRDGVSGLHAKIVNAGKLWKVVDQLASNGTFVNGKRVNVLYLNSGDRIAFGPVECLFETPNGKRAATASASAGGGTGASTERRGKRGLLIAGLSFLGTLILLLVLLKWLG
jgi:pSer/pThr/pTyr-binding forkhead associated (FHA) protein